MALSGSLNNVNPAKVIHRDNGAVMVSMFDESLNSVHLHFATPYEAWKWAKAMETMLKDSITLEQQEVVNA